MSQGTGLLVSWAGQVHKALSAPPLQRIGDFDIACAIVAARRIPGDFVFSFAHHGNWYLALGDLMGKGLSAAMWLTHAIDLIRRACESDRILPEIMGSLNREIHRSRVGIPLTSLFMARLDSKDSTLTYSCAGCPPAFLLNRNRAVALLYEGGPILGALPEATYASGTVQFALKETLLAVSDGVIEVHHGHNFELRPDRVVEHLKNTAGASAMGVVHSLVARMKSADNTVVDDLSLLAIQHIAEN